MAESVTTTQNKPFVNSDLFLLKKAKTLHLTEIPGEFPLRIMFGFLSGRCSLGSYSRKKQTDSLRDRQTHKFLFGKFTTNFS